MDSLAKWPSEFAFPNFEDLPIVQGQPQGCLWGFFDKDGKKDELGTLNLLTSSVVREAAAEIRLGKSLQLDWSLKETSCPGYGRIPIEHTVKDLRSAGFVAFDEEIRINTQTSSQWDGLRHWGLQESALFYNNVKHAEVASTDVLGIHNICERGGIVGRGVLVDWVRWWQHAKPGIPVPAANTTHSIPMSEIEEAARFQNTTFKQGDIFIVRTGYLACSASQEDRKSNIQDEHRFIGIESSEATVRWLYSKHFAAVAGDAMGFEAWPYPKNCSLHEWLLALWGTPIGELWDIEKLSQTCADLGRWEFFLTSAPLNLPGGIASPPCAIAIF
ncbi:hypothetical protein BDZ85DRAFT_279791 [Elsinoe ampelina]|uniref:Cyclase-domain-containing protein n=1 Tax=Elsinoe ampelina TaxID=302913 RepID=A0A6A6GK81_9PEZI|nr:hypothetical protein BDZ85DRAFT_279791 [Elsinoe ampelina]